MAWHVHQANLGIVYNPNILYSTLQYSLVVSSTGQTERRGEVGKRVSLLGGGASKYHEVSAMCSDLSSPAEIVPCTARFRTLDRYPVQL